jgi:glycosyltransferase involved in cell wall biosynthesis
VKRVIAIVPALNEERNLGSLLPELKAAGLDVIVVNDASSDRTEDVALANSCAVISLPFNLGIGGAVQTGYRYALYHGYDFAVQIDGDGQHDPKFIPAMIRQLNRGSNLVVGSRYLSRRGYQSTLCRRIAKNYIGFLIRLIAGVKLTDPTSGFRACDSQLIQLFARKYPNDYPEPESLLLVAKRGYRLKEIPVEMRDRRHGRSSIRALGSVYYVVKITIALLLHAFSREA